RRHRWSSRTSRGAVFAATGPPRANDNFRTVGREHSRIPPMRVLIADDHPVVRQGLKQILMSDPDVVVSGEARDGDEALDLARRVDWDVAIIDFSMPGVHGLDLIGEIKREFP